MVKIYKIGVWLFAAMVILAMFSVQALYSRFTWERPNHPVFETGQIIPLNAYYGKIVYIDKNDNVNIYLRWGCVVGSIAGCALMVHLQKNANSRTGAKLEDQSS
jgi:hypothetical protein